MDSASRENEGTISRNDSYSSKLASQNSSAGQHVDSQQQKQQLIEELRDSDWEQLEEKYAKAMEEHGKSEEELRAQVARLLEVILLCSYPQGYVIDCSMAGLCSMVPNYCFTRRGQSLEKVDQHKVSVQMKNSPG